MTETRFKPKKIDPEEWDATLSDMFKALELKQNAANENDLIKLLEDENYAFDMMERSMVADYIRHLEERLTIHNITIEEE